MSVPFDATDVIAWTGARWIQGREDVRFAGVSIDSRSVGSDELFIAIRGVHHDAETQVTREARFAPATGRRLILDPR